MDIFSGKLIMTDLDGTLLDSGSQISQRNRDAADYFISRGGLLTVATGRSRAGVQVFMPQLPLNAPAVLFNGSCGWDFSADRHMFCWGIDKTVGLALCRYVADAVPGCGIEIHTLDGPWVARANFFTRRHFKNTGMPHRVCRAEDVPGAWVNLCLVLEPELMTKLVEAILGGFSGMFFLQLSAEHMLEVQSPRANKGAAALEICRRLGIGPENLYAAGDGTNDVELLKATQNAFAPAGSHAEVMALGPKILPHNDEHTLEALVRIIEGEILQKTRKDALL